MLYFSPKREGIALEFRSIYITCRDEEEAQRIGRMLVQEKLVACANYFPTKSIYRWKGQIEETGEFALIAKTRASLIRPLIKEIRRNHSYAVPCIVAWPIVAGNPDYLSWVEESTGADKST